MKTCKNKFSFSNGIWMTEYRVHTFAAKYNLLPTAFCRWQKAFFENGASALDMNTLLSPSPRNKKVGPFEFIGKRNQH
jgi:hypothetical protein